MLQQKLENNGNASEFCIPTAVSRYHQTIKDTVMGQFAQSDSEVGQLAQSNSAVTIKRAMAPAALAVQLGEGCTLFHISRLEKGPVH